MTTLYNCHHDGDQYRITKFSEHGEVESSYLCTETECECPAGVRDTCRHRQMLPMFLNREAVDTFWFLDWDRKGWVMNDLSQPAIDTIAPEGLTVDTDDADDYGEDPIGLESLPPRRPTWRRI